MWLDSRSGRSSGVVSQHPASGPTTRSCCSRSSTAQTDRASRGPHKSGSALSSAWRVPRSRRVSLGSSRRDSSWSMNRAVRGGRRGTGSARNLPDSRSGWCRETCPINGAGWERATCPTGGHEVTTRFVRCSRVSSMGESCIDTIGQLAARCPSGEEAQGEVTLGVGHGLARSRSRWLMMTRWQDARSRHPGGGSVDADNVAASQPEHKTRAGGAA